MDEPWCIFVDNANECKTDLAKCLCPNTCSIKGKLLRSYLFQVDILLNNG